MRVPRPALFALTPALSPWERELNELPLGYEKIAFVQARQRHRLPLPWGEGWGEGEVWRSVSNK